MASLAVIPPTDYSLPENWHEAAQLFPTMDDAELQALAADIKANGLRNPIILLGDKVLDGRNRLLACKIAGVRPDFQPRNPEKLGSPVAWVLSNNLHRRHLTTTQRAAIAVEAEKLFAVEAKERQKQGKAKLPDPEHAGQARDQAAKACSVSPRYVQDAKKIAVESPKTAAEMKAGKISMADAKRVAPLEKSNPKLYKRILNGELKPRDAKPAPTKKSRRERYSEPDFFARIARCVEGILCNHPLLDEIAQIKKSDWTAEAAEAFPHIIARLNEVNARVDNYVHKLRGIAKQYGRKAA